MFQIFTKLADWFIFILKLNPESKLASSIHFFVEDSTKIFFLLVLMVYLASLLRAGLSPEKVRLWLQGRSRWIGYLLAVILGSITPFCSCSSVPLFIGFLTAGIPLGIAMAFLITSPMVNEIAVALFAEAFGWSFTVTYIILGMITGIIGGFLVDTFAKKDWVEDYVWQIKFQNSNTQSKQLCWKDYHNNALEEVKDIVGRVWKYALIGIILGSLLHGYIPKELFIVYAGVNNPFSVTIASLIGIPLYSNITGIVPIAKVLIEKGLPIGTTLAFIMSTVAISLPELFILRKVLKPKALIFFVFILFIAFNIVGYLFNWLFKTRGLL